MIFMRFSIIIPLYNCEKTIRKVINCLKNQTFPKNQFEIIGVDDKSGDRTISLIDKIVVKLIKFDENQGNGKAKNFGIAKAKGEILIFIDDHLYLDANALENLNFLFNKYPKISGICGFYTSFKKSDMNVCRDIRRRVIYGKDRQEKIIALNLFSPFSIGLGAIKASMFNKFQFPEIFSKGGAEDTLFQIESCLKGKIFLYSPLVKGLHDHGLNFQDICRKLFSEIKSVGILMNYSSKKDMLLPFQYCFLSYPLLFMLGLLAIILNRFFATFLILAIIFEIFLSAACFKDKQAGTISRFKAFIYCFSGEIIKGFYLLLCITRGSKFNFTHVFRIIKQFLYWEKMKFKLIF